MVFISFLFFNVFMEVSFCLICFFVLLKFLIWNDVKKLIMLVYWGWRILLYGLLLKFVVKINKLFYENVC